MAPAKLMTIAGASLAAAAAVVALLLFSGHAGPTAALVLRLDIVALIAGVILAVSGLVFADMRKLFWENARASLRKDAGDKHA